MRRSLALLLLLLSPVAALADDLRQWVPARELPGILERLRRDHHPHFAVVDYGQRSSEPRFLLFERRSHALLGRFRVSHGRGSDADHDGYAERFSDRPGSLASSLGVFRTAEVFQSEAPGHGLSMRLEGLSRSNHSAMARAIVVHARDYMERDFIEAHGVAGRSNGCLVLASTDRDRVIRQLQGGALIFAIGPR